MLAFGRVVGAFIMMMIAGYLAVVVFFPAPPSVSARSDELMTGRSASVRLTEEAQALVGHKPVTNFQ